MDISWQVISVFKRLAEQSDILHVHYPWPFMDLVLAVTRIKKPIVLTYHSDIVRQRFLRLAYQPLESRTLTAATAIVATSPNYARTSSNLRKFSDKVVSIPLALDERSYHFPDHALPHGLRPNEYVLFVGMLRYYKGLDTLLEACARFHFPVVIAGEGPESEPLRRKAIALGLDHVTFLGQVSDELKSALLKNCRFFVFPSNKRSEAFGMSLVEAAMYGKAMLSCELGTGTSYINQNGLTGVVVKPNNPNALGESMQYLWVSDEARNSMGQAARVRFLYLFEAQSMGTSYSNLYMKLLR